MVNKQMVSKDVAIWRYPISQERELLRAINMAFDDIKRVATDSVMKKLPEFYEMSRNDAEEYEEEQESWSEELAAILLALLFLGRINTSQKKRFFEIAKMASSYNEVQFAKIINRAFGVNPVSDLRLGTLSTWLDNVVIYAQKRIEAFTDDIVAIARDAVVKKTPLPDVKSLIVDKSNQLDNASKLLAVNSIGDLNSELQQDRLTDAGIYKYKWVSQQDDRVRPDHVAKNGKIFDWRKRPEGGHPGEPIRCRCVAYPVVEKGDTLEMQRTAWTDYQIKAYRRGVGREQRPERDAKYRAVMRSGKFTKQEIKLLSENPSAAPQVFQNIITSGRASQKDMISLMAKESFV